MINLLTLRTDLNAQAREFDRTTTRCKRPTWMAGDALYLQDARHLNCEHCPGRRAIFEKVPGEERSDRALRRQVNRLAELVPDSYAKYAYMYEHWSNTDSTLTKRTVTMTGPIEDEPSIEAPNEHGGFDTVHINCLAVAQWRDDV